jgi:signal transduction histidine kinase
MNQPATKKLDGTCASSTGSIALNLAHPPISKTSVRILLGVADNGLAKTLASQLMASTPEATIVTASSLPELRELLTGSHPGVVFLDTDVLSGRSISEAVRQLSIVAPLIILTSVNNQAEIAKLIPSSNVDFIGRVGEFIPVAIALIERRLKKLEINSISEAEPGSVTQLGELFRHEINNPLTGILGNAELVLAHRDHLSPMDVQRLQTVVDLAVRLRESIRRISSQYEGRNPASNSL